jgi:hypothetical protein
MTGTMKEFKETYGPYYALTPKEKRVRERFLIVLYPQPRGAQAPAIKGFNAQGGHGIEVAVPGGRNLHLYRARGDRVAAQGLDTDGLTCMAGLTTDGGCISYALVDGTEMKRDGKVLISCDQPSSLAFAKWSGYARRSDRLPVKTVTPNALFGALSLPKETRVRFFAGRPPQSVTIGGRAVEAFEFEERTGLLSVSLPRGDHEITIVLQ